LLEQPGAAPWKGGRCYAARSLTPRRIDWLTVSRKVTLTLTLTVLQIADPSSRQRGRPRRREKQFSDKRKEKVESSHGPQRGARHQDILTDWPSVVK
jgi:hypothetical protein